MPFERVMRARLFNNVSLLKLGAVVSAEGLHAGVAGSMPGESNSCSEVV